MISSKFFERQFGDRQLDKIKYEDVPIWQKVQFDKNFLTKDIMIKSNLSERQYDAYQIWR